jgi:hypothetical protein
MPSAELTGDFSGKSRLTADPIRIAGGTRTDG